MNIATFHLIIVIGSLLVSLFFFLFWNDFGPLERVMRSPVVLKVCATIAVTSLIIGALLMVRAETDDAMFWGMIATIIALIASEISLFGFLRGVRKTV